VVSPELLQAIKAAVEQKIAFEVALVALLCVVATAVGAFGSSFLAKSGEHSARRHFADTLLKLDSAQARAIEAAKAEITTKVEAFKEELRLESTKVQELLRQQLSLESFAFQKYVDALSDLARVVGAGSHAICWVSWVAKFNATALSDAQMHAYEAEINSLLSKLVGARVALAALNPAAHDTLSPLLERLYDLDIAAGLARASFSRSPTEGCAAWAALYDQSWEFDRAFLRTVVSLAVKQPSQPRAA
jgi:hypothetical protein